MQLLVTIAFAFSLFFLSGCGGSDSSDLKRNRTTGDGTNTSTGGNTTTSGDTTTDGNTTTSGDTTTDGNTTTDGGTTTGNETNTTTQDDCAKSYFADEVTSLLQSCTSCHTSSGIAGSTDFVINDLSAANADENFFSVKEYVLQTGTKIIEKNNGAIAHAGGAGFDMLDSMKMDLFIDYVKTPESCMYTTVISPKEDDMNTSTGGDMTTDSNTSSENDNNTSTGGETSTGGNTTPVITEEDLEFYDKDLDGVFDIFDLYPNDAQRVGERAVKREIWRDINVETMSELLNSDLLSTQATENDILEAGFVTPVNQYNNFAQRIKAYLKPKETGDYNIYVAVDDGASVWLSEDANPLNKKKIIENDRWTPVMNFTKYSQQKSERISLEAGKVYYLEVIAYEGGGGDHLSLAYSIAGSSTGIQMVSSDMIESYYAPEGVNLEDYADMDSDGIPFFADTDNDNDGILDVDDQFPLVPVDTDNDGLADIVDTDDDNDGVLDIDDKYPLDASKSNDGVVEATLNASVIQAKCVSCHSDNGSASYTKLKFRRGNTAAVVNYNETELSFYITQNGGDTLLNKSRGLNGHGGGAAISLGSNEYELLKDYVSKFTTTGGSVTPNDGTYVLESPAQTYRRASLYLKGEIPSASKLESMQSVSEQQLKMEILALMSGEGFHNFLKDGANDRLHSRHHKTSDNGTTEYNKFYKKNADDSRTDVRQDLAEEPLELIAYVVENDLPYSEILTADYTMVGQYTDESYNTGLDLAPGEWKKSKNRGQEIKTEETYGDDATGDNRLTDYPHAGVLSTWAFLSRYPTTATNRNRTRANWTMQHFLGYNIEKSAARVIDISEVGDEENPIMNNTACTSCHDIMDPIAGAYKYFHERVGYKAYGTDSLDGNYRRNNIGVDNWYHDVLPAGYRDLNAPSSNDPLQWLAKRLVEDYRFAESVVKFWWLPVFGENVLDDESADAKHFDTQSLLITALANDFREHMNLKQLLADMMMSDSFRAEEKVSGSILDSDMNIHMGARHLLTGRALKNKTESLTGFVWGNSNAKLDKEYYMLYGGIDDIAVENRPTDLTNIMFKVAERQALELGCAVVVYDFDFNKSERRLFTQVERDTLDESDIKQQIVVLFERMLSRTVSIDSEQVSEAYSLFLELQEAHKNQAGNSRINTTGVRCDNKISGSTNDDYHVLAPWRGLVIALMTDPDYLYE